MSKIIKKDQFEQTQSLDDRLSHLSHELSTDRRQTASKIVSHHAQHIQEEAQAILNDAKTRALALQQEARKLLEEVEQLVESRRQEGFDDGYQEGLSEATERLTAISKLESDFLKDVEPKLVRLVYDIAERLLARELSENREVVTDMVRQALRTASGSQLLVRLNPEDYRVVKSHEKELLQSLDGVSTLSVREDERVSTGGCIIESEIGTIDAQLPAQLAAIRRALDLE